MNAIKRLKLILNLFRWWLIRVLLGKNLISLIGYQLHFRTQDLYNLSVQDKYIDYDNCKADIKELENFTRNLKFEIDQ